MVLSVSRAGGGHAIVGGGKAGGNDRVAVDDADHGLAGDCREVFGLVVVFGAGAGADVPGGHHGELPWQPRQWRDSERLPWKLAHGRSVSGHQLHHLSDNQDPGRELHHLGGGWLVSDTSGLSASDKSFGELGQTVAGGYNHLVQR